MKKRISVALVVLLSALTTLSASGFRLGLQSGFNIISQESPSSLMNF